MSVSLETSATPSATSSDVSSASSTALSSSDSSGGVSKSLYLFTFLITIVVLGLISMCLLFRAYYVRRQFHRAVTEAIAAGRPVPQGAALALGLVRGQAGFARGKNAKEVGRMPSLHEAVLWRDAGEEKEALRRDWEGLEPLAMVTFPSGDPPPPPILSVPVIPQPRGPRMLRPFLPPVITEEAIAAAVRPLLDAEAANLSAPVLPTYVPPKEGEECVVGVMIALPVAPGRGAEKWDRQEEEGDVPEVCLGVMKCWIGNGVADRTGGDGVGHGYVERQG